MTVSETLAGYIERLGDCASNAEVAEAARMHFADTVACIAAGSGSAAAAAVASAAAKKNAAPTSTALCSGGFKTGVHEAAMINAVSAHCRDYDDMSIGLNGHASAVLVPVCIALGEQRHSSGRDVLNAYIAGVEADSLLGKMLHGSGYYKGWNTSCTVGTVGAAVAAGKLLGLNEAQLVEAIGMAAGASACVKENYGTAAKDISLAMTAHNAVFAAEMAELGCNSNHKVFEGENGIYKSVGIDRSVSDFKAVDAGHVSDFLAPGMIIKPYPTCRGNHNALDCFMTIVRENALQPEDIKRVRCRVDQAAMDTDKYPFPTTAEQAKFSMRYCLGLMLYKRELSTADFDASASLDERAVRFMDKVDVSFDPEIKDARFGTAVTVETVDGRSFEKSGRFASGDPMNPISGEAMRAKLRQCFGAHYPAEQTDAIIGCLESLDRLGDISELTSLLA